MNFSHRTQSVYWFENISAKPVISLPSLSEKELSRETNDLIKTVGFPFLEFLKLL